MSRVIVAGGGAAGMMAAYASAAAGHQVHCDRRTSSGPAYGIYPPPESPADASHP